MAKQQFNTRLPAITVKQIERLERKTGMTQTQLVIVAIDRMAQQEVKEAAMFKSHADLTKAIVAGKFAADDEIYRHDDNFYVVVRAETDLQGEEDADKYTFDGYTGRVRLEQRIDGSDALAPYRDLLLYDWPEGVQHWEWASTASEEEIVSWAQVIRQDQEEYRLEQEENS